MSDEFDVDVDDYGSAERIAESVVKLWAAEPTTAAKWLPNSRQRPRKEARSKCKLQGERATEIAIGKRK
ncbi:hypothetical protein RHS01_02037 [Rhizoctonia solani]|uniref:Uncharacterized protein n=1 Tax=Rhizoctonia solani TaxID=456999 RepID=A0A8H7IKR6_9AGAM|nr:hypothetical protein RHS01_02037 [Rhizoctonia solani]